MSTPAVPQLFRHISTIVPEVLEETRLRADYPDLGVFKTGIDAFDEHASATFAPGRLAVFAGESGRGKTALAAQCAAGFAAQAPVLWFSLEDEAGDAVKRQLANVGRIDVGTIRSGAAISESHRALESAAAHLAGLDLSIIDGVALAAEQIAQQVFAWKQHTGAETGVVIIDQLSHIAPTTDRDPDRWARMGFASPPPPGANEVAVLGWQVRLLKLMAQKLGVFVIVLHQLNEDHARGTEPTERSVRSSREIVHGADLIMIPYVPDQLTEANPFAGNGQTDTMRRPNESGEGFFIIVKGRIVQRGKIEVRWDGRHQRWAPRVEAPGTGYVAPKPPTARAAEGARKLAALHARLNAERDARHAGTPALPSAQPTTTTQPVSVVAVEVEPAVVEEPNLDYDPWETTGADYDPWQN
jgi:replicative DNA helicase